MLKLMSMKKEAIQEYRMKGVDPPQPETVEKVNQFLSRKNSAQKRYRERLSRLHGAKYQNIWKQSSVNRLASKDNTYM